MKNVVLIDGHSLLFRAYHALPKTFTDKEGHPTNAVYGFVSMLIRVVADLKPDYLAVAFDEKGPTFRHQELVTYKEGRPEMDEELTVQGPVVRRLLSAFGIPVYSIEGYEGEDIIATIVAKIRNSKLETRNLEIFIVSSDRDVLQLVNRQVKVYSPKKGLSEPVIYGPENVSEVFGVKAEEIPDYKGLRGDPTDRIPGVFGIGEKMAQTLINQYGSVEKIYQNLNEIKQTLGETVWRKLSEGAEAAVLSRKIAQINSDAPVTPSLRDLEFTGLKKEAIRRQLADLGFKSLLKRLGYKDEVKSPAKLKTKPVMAEGQASFLVDQ